ncbi:MAG: DUF6152 family protein [Gammaproteobacteria bacterium]|jgi:hypothetical protein
MATQLKPVLHTMIPSLVAMLAMSGTFSGAASAHHSFAVYDFTTEIAFEGTVETVNFKNPHIAMTLAYEDENGEMKIANFVEGAPANMLIRNGFNPAWLDPGSKITAIGSPRHDNPDALFLKAVILEDGSEHRAVGR